jgi:tryptophan synthase alpha chain
MNKVSDVFKSKKDILNIYITAGYPKLESTIDLIKKLDEQNVDIIEVGVPYSDPLADGTTIQKSSEAALKNGMKLHILFDQLNSLKDTIKTPLIMMGYFNQMLQFGPEKYLHKANEAGVSAMIIPDLPMSIYERDFKALFEKYGIEMCFLITPFTSDERIKKADELSTGFIYVVSQTSITGKVSDIQKEQINYFNRIKEMNLNAPKLIGFGIHDKQTFATACEHSEGAIIGSAFIRALDENDVLGSAQKFLDKIR